MYYSVCVEIFTEGYQVPEYDYRGAYRELEIAMSVYKWVCKLYKNSDDKCKVILSKVYADKVVTLEEKVVSE